MKQFHEQFKDRVDASDGSVVLREPEFSQIQEEAFKDGLNRAVEAIRARHDSTYVGHNPIREGIKRGLSDAMVDILTISATPFPQAWGLGAPTPKAKASSC